MPREIKFRAWLKESNQMASVLVLHLSSLNGRVLKAEVNNGHVTTWPLLESIELMEFTGNTDKAKKEIYEGDIMKIQLPVGGFWGNTPTEKIGVVRYEAECGGFIVEWEYSKNQHHIILTCDIAHTGEVIGNAFQNPTLIKHS